MAGSPYCVKQTNYRHCGKVSIISEYSASLWVLLLFEIIIATIGTIATLTWIGMGVLIQRAYQKYYRVINIILALTLSECVYSMLK